MFTGIVAEVGHIRDVSRTAGSAVLTIGAERMMDALELGESVAVDGVCLTVTGRSDKSFTVDVSPETLRTTTLGERSSGDGVNLERSLRLGDRLGGHQVSGHVDGVGTIRRCASEGSAVIYTIEAAPELMRYVVPRGSIAVDGISLTVVRCSSTEFTVSIIPFTARETTIGVKRPGDRVNLECDVIAKYVEKLLGGLRNGVAGEGQRGLDERFLSEHGFA